MKRTALKALSQSDTAQTKRRIQALMRSIAILRDGGCVLRNYHQTGSCGGYNAKGELILQAEHLLTRASAGTFGDMRNIVCLCQRHHIFYKPQYSQTYWECIENYLGPARWGWYLRAKQDRTPHRQDWKLVEIDLEHQLRQLQAQKVV